MERKVDRSENTSKKYEAPRVRRVRLDAAGSVLSCAKKDTGCSPGMLFS